VGLRCDVKIAAGGGRSCRMRIWYCDPYIPSDRPSKCQEKEVYMHRLTTLYENIDRARIVKLYLCDSLFS